jgi:hypothetical protein
MYWVFSVCCGFTSRCLVTADVPLPGGSRTVSVPQLPASISNSSQGLNRSGPLTHSFTPLTLRVRESYFTTGGLPPVSWSWRQAPWDSRPDILFLQLSSCGNSPYVTISLTRSWVMNMLGLVACYWKSTNSPELSCLKHLGTNRVENTVPLVHSRLLGYPRDRYSNIS